MGAIKDVERPRGIVAMSFLFSGEAILSDRQRDEILQALDPEFLHVLERIVPDPNGLEFSETRKVEWRDVRVVTDSVFEVNGCYR